MFSLSTTIRAFTLRDDFVARFAQLHQPYCVPNMLQCVLDGLDMTKRPQTRDRAPPPVVAWRHRAMERLRTALCSKRRRVLILAETSEFWRGDPTTACERPGRRGRIRAVDPRCPVGLAQIRTNFSAQAPKTLRPSFFFGCLRAYFRSRIRFQK